MTVYLEELQKQSEDFSQIRFCLAQLEQITIGEEILKMVEGVDINFAELPVQKKKRHTIIKFPQNKYMLLIWK